jgi:soluble lytic murein transglycosylase-like protein
MIMNAYEPVILSSSLKYDIPSEWVKGIITQESNWDPFAVRYEPTYSYLFHVSEYANRLGISIQTETQCQKMSWGLGQLMGALARELGHQGQMGLLFDLNINIDLLSKRLAQLKKISPIPDDVFAMYNGGPGALKKVNGKYTNQSYVDSVKKNLMNQN